MRNKILMSTLLLSLFGGLTLSMVSCNTNKPGTNENQNVSNVTKSLIVDTSRMKTNYYVGDILDTSGLQVKLVTTKDGVSDEGVLTTDYTLSISNGDTLKADDKVITITSTSEGVTGTSFEINVSLNNVYKYLEVDTSNMIKTSYFVGETLDTTGLVVKLITETNGVSDEGVDYTNYTLSIPSTRPLTINDKEVIVKANEKGIISSEFTITVTPRPSLKKLPDFINFMHDTNNYTVTSKIGGNNNATGLVTKNGVLWSSDVEGYYLDEGFGYAEYKQNTFRFEIDKKTSELKNPRFINELGGKAMDFGLFDKRTVDQYAENRISNYSIDPITEAELTKITTIKPLEDNKNKYPIAIEDSGWLWSAIGNNQLVNDYERFLTNGSSKAQIYIEIIGEELEVTLIPPKNGMIDTCVARISKIGTTEIPGLNKFLEKPVFPNSNLDLTILSLQKVFRSQNYTISSGDGSKIAYYTKKYAFGDCLNPNPNDLNSSIYLESPLTIDNQELIAGYHNIVRDNDTFKIVTRDIGFEKTSYLDNFDIFNYLTAYFRKTDTNKYSADIKEELGKNPRIVVFASLFTDFNLEKQTITKVDLDIEASGENAIGASVKIYEGNQLIGDVNFKDFGTTSYEPLEKYIQELK